MPVREPRCEPIAIGSFPYKNPAEALEQILIHFPRIPLWPQLPLADDKEQMYVQFFDGMPGIHYDDIKGKLVAEEIGDKFFEEIAEEFEHIMSKDYDYFKISPNKATGLYYFLENEHKIKALNPFWVKGQVTGPVSFSLSITDREMKPVLYSEPYREAILGALKMKSLWQVNLLKKIHPEIIIFIDEPCLANLGSSMVALSSETASKMIGEITVSLREPGVLSGVHCCGNTDWTFLFKNGCDIISMDAYEYGENFLLYADSIIDFIKRGGMLAWGIVPTSKAADNESPDSLIEKLEVLLNKLKDRGMPIKAVLKQSFISPSCGLGNVEVKRAERIMRLTGEISKKLYTKHDLQ